MAGPWPDVARPRLGYFGVIDERIDLALLDRLAHDRPPWQILMVGPFARIDPDKLPRRSNIHWLGQHAYESLPRLVAFWDVCLMPFALNEATRYISPAKTLEYMAAGKPIVSTHVRDVADCYSSTVRVADSVPAFIKACDAALAEPEPERSARRQAMIASRRGPILGRGRRHDGTGGVQAGAGALPMRSTKISCWARARPGSPRRSA